MLLLVVLAASAPLLAATAEDLYTAALTHERELRSPADETPTLAQLRDGIAAYTEIVRQYPRSGYSDNALWQAAGLAIHAFDRHRRPTDRDAGVRFLRMLEHEYPSSSLVPRVADRLEQLRHLDGPVQIRSIHRASLADVVRVTIELDDEVHYDAVRLDGPARLFFDFTGTYAPPPLRDATLAFDDDDIVREIRLGRHPGQTTRVVLDIEDIDTYSVFSLYNPYRLVVDMVPTASMQARRARPDAASLTTGLGATRDFHHGLLAVAGGTGPPPTDRVDDPFPADTADTVEIVTTALAPTDSSAALASGGARQRDEPPAASSEPVASVDLPAADVATLRVSALDRLPVPTGVETRWLDPVLPALEPTAADFVDTESAISTYEPVTDLAPPAPSAPDLAPSATVRNAMPQPADQLLAWPQVHDVLYPDLGSPPSPDTAGDPPPADEPEPAAEPFHVTPLRPLEAVERATVVFPLSLVDVAPPARVERTVEIVHQASAPAEPAVVEVAVASLAYLESPGAETAVANSGGDYSLGRQLGLGVSRIVIDPGHGGYDPGAQTSALTESALVLDVAQRLEARLTAETGIEVVLTRRRDAYVPLRARTELANRVSPDLFLSIHANAASDRRARGVETYYLQLATDSHAQAVAARENAASRESMHDLPRLVRSITMNNKQDESRDLAGMIQRNLVGAVRELHPGAQDLGVKQAPFVVLIGANMPSVLAEISFLTNQEDAAFLATDAYRSRIADALLQSILEYQQALKPSTSFAAGNND